MCGPNGPVSWTRTNTGMARSRRHQPDPTRFPLCARCGQCYPGGASWPEGRVCKYCYLQARLRTGSCTDCGALTSLPGLNSAGNALCTRCSIIPAAFHCGCGRAVTAGENGRCWWCVLTDQIDDVLAGPDGAIPVHLQPLTQGLGSMPRPQSGALWLRRSATARETLQDLAHGRIDCSHAALDGAGANRAIDYLRALLVHHGVLPPRDRRLADFQRWAATKLDGIAAAEQRRPLERFVEWRLLRHLRSCSTSNPLTHGPYQRAKQHLTMAIAFLAWLSGRGRHLDQCTQHDIDEWFGNGPTTRQHAITFLSWAGKQRTLRGIDLPVINTSGTEQAPPTAHARRAAIRRLLLDDALRLDDRIVGCLVVLYGQHVSRIAALRTTDVSCADSTTRLKLGADWLDVPEPVATLVRQHMANRRTKTTATTPTPPWLFPGQLPGEHRSYNRLVRVLHQLGIPAQASRLAAWRELARQTPPAVLADALGVSPDTAMRHAQLAGADWAAYAARRN